MDLEEAYVRQANVRLGTVLCGKYTVDRILGVGGMAVVYAATHRNQKQVAIKMLHAELSLHEEIRRRFLREGYVANSVKHRGAVDVIDDDVAEDGAAFIVMEYLDGLPVDGIANARAGTLPLGAALVVVHELCGVLAAAHARGIVHRDIKPANLFVTTEGELKVLDFGIARLRDSSSGQATNTGMMMGTPAFMAPEQARGDTPAIGAVTDIWAAGATLFNLLSGANVHDADTAQMLMIKVATTPPRSLATVMPDLPHEVIAIVDKALAFDIRQRWADAESMRAALRAAYVGRFGELTVGRALAPLLGGTLAGESAPAPSGSSTNELAGAATELGPVARLPVSSKARESLAHGGTTAFPVTASFVEPITSKKTLGISLAMLAILGGCIGWFAFRDRSDPRPTTMGAAIVESAAPAVPVTSSAGSTKGQSPTVLIAETDSGASAPVTTAGAGSPPSVVNRQRPVIATRPPATPPKTADVAAAPRPPSAVPPPPAAPAVAPDRPPVDPGSIR